MTTRRRAALLLSLALLGPGLAACGGSDDDADDAVASLTGDDGADAEEASDDGDGGGGQPRREMSAEERDALLEFAQCMRDNGVDMPDPEVGEDGGVSIRAGGPAEGGESGGPGDEEWEAAQEECQPIMDEAMPEVDIDPEEQAEMQDRLVEVAECMRERGYDMPDPEVDENGRVTMRIGGPGGGDVEPAGPDDDQQQDMEECEDEAGMEGPRLSGDGESGDGDGGDS